MRICRFNDDRIGLVDGDTIADVTAALRMLPSSIYPLPRHDVMIAGLDQLRPAFETLAQDATRFPLNAVRLTSPIANPGKIIAAPVNYADHVAEAEADAGINFGARIARIHEIGLFLKATGALVGPSEGVAIEHRDRRTDHEIELVAVIGKRGRNIAVDTAMAHVAGYAIGLDMTVRGPEERSMRKSVDGFAVLGPWFVTADEIDDPGALDLHLSVNGETRQRANTRDLVLGIAELIAYASSFYTLEPGDLIYTGTPAGVGPVSPGDHIAATIPPIGTLDVDVR